jgi:hypothetical protein
MCQFLHAELFFFLTIILVIIDHYAPKLNLTTFSTDLQHTFNPNSCSISGYVNADGLNHGWTQLPCYAFI